MSLPVALHQYTASDGVTGGGEGAGITKYEVV
jgi:hypothetical protein